MVVVVVVVDVEEEGGVSRVYRIVLDRGLYRLTDQTCFMGIQTIAKKKKYMNSENRIVVSDKLHEHTFSTTLLRCLMNSTLIPVLNASAPVLVRGSDGRRAVRQRRIRRHAPV